MNEEYINININYDNKFNSLLKKYIPKIEEINKEIKKPKYEFQESTKKFAKIYGRRIYSLVYETFYNDYRIQKAHEITEKYCKGNIKYLIKVMRNLP